MQSKPHIFQGMEQLKKLHEKLKSLPALLKLANNDKKFNDTLSKISKELWQKRKF